MAKPNRNPASGRARRFLLASALCAGAFAGQGLVLAAPAAAKVCEFAPVRQIDREVGVEPLLKIDGDCTDPIYNTDTFVVDKTEQLTFQIPDGPLVTYTQISGHFPAAPEALAPYVRQSPLMARQDYVFRFPAKEYFKNRSFEQQHPSGGGVVDNHMAFVNGAFSVNWMSASVANSVASHRHEAAATKIAKALARDIYGDTGKIYSYFWGCSGGGIVSMAAAENTEGVWDGVQVHCTGPKGIGTYHSFLWQAHYTLAVPPEKADAVAAAAEPGGTGEIYAGLDDEQKAVLDEFISAGYPLPIIKNRFKSLIPVVDPIDIRMKDPAYEDDFWSKPGYAGTNPPEYLEAALVDAPAKITRIERDADGAPTLLHFDPTTLPDLGRMGQNYLEFWVYDEQGKRLIDPTEADGAPSENQRRYTLKGKYDPAAATLALTGTLRDHFGNSYDITNSPLLLGSLREGGDVRINNRFILAMYFYPRYSNIEGMRSYDQYRQADGTPMYPQRKDTSVLEFANYRTMGGRSETGDIKTKVIIMEGRSDNLSWPLFNASYAEQIEKALGPEKARKMMRFYLHDNGRHGAGGGEPGTFQQAMQDMMDWVEDGKTPPQSTSYTIVDGQVVPPASAAERGGLQPVMSLAANGKTRAKVQLGKSVKLSGEFEMPPATGKIVHYSWTIDGKEDGSVAVENPQPKLSVSRTITFDEPGTHVVRLTVEGQRDGKLRPINMALPQNFKVVQVVVE